ncbi:MAG TPA: DoxX-like family protein [Burkholderiales bacterium]|nr:DoxX-like family protein [Burkholderiales bacterium]
MADRPDDLLRHIERICRFTVAGIWAFQGLVPKLLGPDADELLMASAFGIRPEFQHAASYAAGAAELLLAACVLLSGRVWPYLASIAVAAGLLVFVLLYAPRYLGAAFNPVVMNVALAALSGIGALVARARPAREQAP